MEVAGPWPLSIFRGRPWPQPGEPLWLDDDRRWALAAQQDADERLPCGCHPSDTSGAHNEDAFDAIPRVCHRHRAVGEASERRSKSETDSMHGVWFQVERREEV